MSVPYSIIPQHAHTSSEKIGEDELRLGSGGGLRTTDDVDALSSDDASSNSRSSRFGSSSSS